MGAGDRADEAAGETPNTSNCAADADADDVSEAEAEAETDGLSISTIRKVGTDTEKPSSLQRSNLKIKPPASSSSQRMPMKQRQPPRPRPRPSLQRTNSSFNQSMRNLRRNIKSSQSFRALKRQSTAMIEGINQNLPASPSGWALLTLGAASVGLQYELHLQKELTAPPYVFCQTSASASSNGNAKRVACASVLNEKMDRIYNKLSVAQLCVSDSNTNTGAGATTGDEHPPTKEGIFTRTVTPSLFIGTRGLISSAAAYALSDGHRNSHSQRLRKVKRVREVMKMGADGALIVLDWEIPPSLKQRQPPQSFNGQHHQQQQQQQHDAYTNVQKANSIDKPVIILVHGMNNDSSFGYIRSMMRTATERGWIAVCMNLRGQDSEHKIKNNTPRGYNAGYTGDLRGVIQQIEYRLKRRNATADTEQVGAAANFNNVGTGDMDDDNDMHVHVGGPIFLLGYSLGANIVTKYLGEESLHGTLPKCIGGGAAMGNPLHIHSSTIRFPWNVILGSGVKRSLIQNYKSFKAHHEPGFQHAMKKAMLSPTIGALDDAAAPYLVRNDSHPPYTPRIGFKDGEDYWWDSSSHRYVAHVSVPLLKISAQDDFLVFGQFAKKLNHCLENPNVVVVKTRCGGHLGWQESPPKGSGSSSKGFGSWSDVAVADFIEALLQVREEDCKKKRMNQMGKRGRGMEGLPQEVPRMLSKL